MRTVRYMLQLGAFVFFGAWLLCLVANRPFRLPDLRPTMEQHTAPVQHHAKPSPVEMLRSLP